METVSQDELHHISFIYQDSFMIVHDSSQQKTEQELSFGFESAFEDVAMQPPKV